MNVPTIFETCNPRADVLAGTVSEADFAADLAQVIVGNGSPDYLEPERFFSNTYPTRGLKNLLSNVCSRLSGDGRAVASIFRLDTTYGGGKSHSLIALCHAARSGKKISNISEFVDSSLLPGQPVRVAAFDGENADPANGRRMEEGVLAYTPWGEIAFALGGKDGYERVRRSDETCIAPGSETLRELFGGEPCLILLDELSVYLRKVRNLGNARDQLTAFLTSLFKAVESTPRACLVYTLAVGKNNWSTDAYAEENQFIANQMAEAESVSARKATLLNPTEEDEMVQVLRRRLFESIDDTQAKAVVLSYVKAWNMHREQVTDDADRESMRSAFQVGYPLHPEVLKTLTGKTSTLGNFQRVRGMLRLLARTVAHLWSNQPSDATSIHVHHIDPGNEPIRQEIITRLEQSVYVPAISNDVSAGSNEKKSLAEEIDSIQHQGLPPYASYVAKTIFIHTLAFNEPLKGLTPEQLRFSILGPTTDISFIEEARKKFVAESAYLDDRPGAPMRFLAEANLRQVIRRSEDSVDAEQIRGELNDRIREIFEDKTFKAITFPGGPYDVDDEIGDGLPKLVVLGYDAITIDVVETSVPELIERIYTRKGASGSALRSLRNNLVFLVADESRKNDMHRKTRYRLALREMKKTDRLRELAEYQRDKVLELEARSEQELAIAIQQCYRHLFYPSRDRVGNSEVDLAHSSIDTPSTSDRPGVGQRQIVRLLRDLGKLRLPEDTPDSPKYIRDRTPLNKGQISTSVLRDEFRRDPGLPILVGDDVFIRGVRNGVEQGEYVYQRSDLIFGPGDPAAHIAIDEQSIVSTMEYARNVGLWPRTPSENSLPEFDVDEKDEEVGDSTNDVNGDESLNSDVSDSFKAEGVLREALVQVWEQARAAKAPSISVLKIRMFEPIEAFRLLGSIGGVANAKKSVSISGGYETTEGSSFDFDFRGTVDDSQPVREFLASQIRDASSSHLEVGLKLELVGELSTLGKGAEDLTEHLCRFTSGAAEVLALVRIEG